MVAAVYALFVSVCVYKRMKLNRALGLVLAAAKTTAVVMFLVAGAHGREPT